MAYPTNVLKEMRAVSDENVKKVAPTAALKAELEQVKADLALHQAWMKEVRTKSRANPDVGDALFSLMRRYQKHLKEVAAR